MTDKQDVGIRAETRAAGFLRTKGFKILERNVRTPYGEIDLICRDGKTMVFVEVRYRYSTNFGQPEDTILGKKLNTMKQSAEWYIENHKISNDYRLDIVGITGNPPDLTHIQDAS